MCHSPWDKTVCIELEQHTLPHTGWLCGFSVRGKEGDQSNSKATWHEVWRHYKSCHRGWLTLRWWNCSRPLRRGKKTSHSEKATVITKHRISVTSDRLHLYLWACGVTVVAQEAALQLFCLLPPVSGSVDLQNMLNPKHEPGCRRDQTAQILHSHSLHSVCSDWINIKFLKQLSVSHWSRW